MIIIAFEVPGVQPRPKGSLNGRCLRDRKHTIVYREQVADSKKYRNRVKEACVKEMCTLGIEIDEPIIPTQWGAVDVRASFFIAKSRVVSAGKLTDKYWPSHEAAPFPTTHDIGDLDKMCRNVGDALKDARLINDDSQIATWLNPKKRWAPDNIPTTFIEVWEAENER
jgi:Holliday junction resolvase RusA-like endonuclease